MRKHYTIYPTNKAHLLTHPVYIKESFDASRNVVLLEFPTNQALTFEAMRHYIAAHMEECVEPYAATTYYYGYVRALDACVAAFEPLTYGIVKTA